MKQTTYYFDKTFQEFLPLLETHAISTRQVLPGSYLIPPGEDIPNTFYIKSGICRCSAIGEDGNELILSFHGPGSLYPVKCRQFHFALETSVIYKALTPVTVLVLSPAAIQSLVRTNPDFAVAAVDFHTIQLNMFISRQMISLQNDLIAKVATFLYIYQHSYPTLDNRVQLSQDDIALALGISRVQVARAYQILRLEKIIATYRGGIEILDFEQLKNRCSQLIVF